MGPTKYRKIKKIKGATLPFAWGEGPPGPAQKGNPVFFLRQPGALLRGSHAVAAGDLAACLASGEDACALLGWASSAGPGGPGEPEVGFLFFFLFTAFVLFVLL